MEHPCLSDTDIDFITERSRHITLLDTILIKLSVVFTSIYKPLGSCDTVTLSCDTRLPQFVLHVFELHSVTGTLYTWFLVSPQQFLAPRDLVSSTTLLFS